METNTELMDKDMEKKVDFLMKEIKKALPDATILLRKEIRSLYKFRIDREERPSCWLIFTWECLLNHNEHNIIDLLEREKVFESVFNTLNQMKLLIIESRGKICLEKQT